MADDLVEILCILDRSGSMEQIRDDAIGGFNAFVESQREVPGRALLTLVLFDDRYEVLLAGRPLEDVPALTRETFVPRGTTALLDAIGRAIDETCARHAALPEEARPRKVLVAIVTDGAENASQRYTRDQVFERITDRQDLFGWDFLFLAANQDAIAAGGDLGVRRSGAVQFTADRQGTAQAFRRASITFQEARTVQLPPEDDQT